MIGTMEAYAAADGILRRLPGNRVVPLRDILALTYLEALKDGELDSESLDIDALADIRNEVFR